jgi:hypothetical protein
MISWMLLASAWAVEPVVLSSEVRAVLATRERTDGPVGEEMAALAVRDTLRVMIGFEHAPAERDFGALRELGIALAARDGVPVHVGRTYAADVTWAQLPALAALPGIRRVELGRSLGLEPPVDHSAGLIGVDEVREAIARAGGPLTGHGVLVVDFDTGVDLSQPLFYRPDGGLYTWKDTGNGRLGDGDKIEGDLSGALTVLHGETLSAWGTSTSDANGLGEGRLDPDVDLVFLDQDGDGRRGMGTGEGRAALGEPVFLPIDSDGSGVIEEGEPLVRLSSPKVAYTWTAEGGLRTRGQDLLESEPDENGHGTSVLSILVAGEPGISRFAGLAPGADVAAFSYWHDWSSFDWVTAVDTAMDLNPDVILLEVGDYSWEFHDGSSLLEQAVTEAAGKTAAVCPAGNIGANGKHAMRSLTTSGGWAGAFVYGPDYGYSVTSAYPSVVWTGDADIELWFRNGDTGVEMAVPANGDWVTDGDNMWVRAWSDASDRGSQKLDIEWYHWDEPLDVYYPIEGSHFFGLFPDRSVDVHLWAKDNDSSWSGGMEYWQTDWGYDAASSWATSVSSAVVPSTADRCITNGSYAAREDVYNLDDTPLKRGELSDFSGRGPRIDGAEVVDIVAPGGGDIRALGSTDEGYDLHTYRMFGGTSAAGPHAAAAAALLKELDPELRHEPLANAIRNSAKRDAVTGDGPYDDDWGYGRLDVAAAVVEADEVPPDFLVVATDSPLAPVRRLTVIPSEVLIDGPHCSSGGTEVALTDAGTGLFMGLVPAGAEVSCEGTDRSGNVGSALVR